MQGRALLEFTFFFILTFSILSAREATAQIDLEEDPDDHYVSFPGILHSRFYFSRKYTSFIINDKINDIEYLYMPNTTLNMGVGATYNWATLNLAYGFGFLNPDRGQGNTRYLDLQAHAYPKQFIIDFFGQFYKGYYLLPQGKAAPEGENFYVRPDLAIIKLGLFAQYLFTPEKISLRASFLQNEWQYKSGGSFLLGFEAYGGFAGGDSHLVPTMELVTPGTEFKTTRFLDFGPNVGYAYSLIIKKRFFITAVASAGLGAGYTTLEDDSFSNTSWGITPNFFPRVFIGYNSRRWSVNANYVHNHVRLSNNENYDFVVATGNYRLNFIYRFVPGPILKKYLRPVEKIDL